MVDTHDTLKGSQHVPKRPTLALAAAIRRVLKAPVSGQALVVSGQAALAVVGAVGLALPAAADQAGSDQLQEVVVSATRRDTNVEDIPYNITVVSAKTLEENHVTSIADLTKQIAGVSFVDEGPLSLSNIVLRGINANGTDHPSVVTTAPVSTYIGETPLFIPLQIDDLERVEVLRGPQGTLYGSGSLAGTLRFIPKEPDFSGFHASIDADGSQVEVGHDFNDRFNGMVNVPFSPTVAVRVSAGYQHYAGFVDERYIVKLGQPNTAINSPVGIPVSANGNILGPLEFTPKDNANDSNQSHVRAALLFKPDADFSALFSYYHQNDAQYGLQAISPNFGGNVDTPPAQNPFYSPSYPVSFPTGGTVFPHNSTYDTNDSFLLQTKRHTDLLAADLSYNFGFATLSSDTSYYQNGGTDVQDNTGLLTLYPSFYGFIPRMVDYQTDYDHTNGFVQEFRLVSKPGVHFDYVIGAFYERMLTSSGQMQWIPGQTYFGGLVGDPGANAATLGDVNVIANTQTYFRDLAGFGELTWHVTDAWQVTGGARQFSQDFSLNTSTAFPFCGVYCGNNGDALGTTTVDKGYAAHDHIFKLNSSYKFSDALNAYVDYSQGFRRGGANGIPVSGPFAANPALLIYTPDKTKNYEVGAKGNLNGFHYSAAVFYIDWINFQVDATSVASGSAIAVNGPKAKSKGIELEFNGAIVPGLTYDVGYTYTRAQVAEDFSVVDFNTSKQPVDIITGKNGDPLPNAPKNSVTLAFDYTHGAPFLEGWDSLWHINSNYRSATLSQLLSTDPNAPPPFVIHGFSIWDASAGLSDRHGLTTSLYIQNMFNSLGITGGQDRGAVGIRGEHFFVSRPRTVGIRVGYAF
jgi:iron complex outermembrane receptor protein